MINGIGDDLRRHVAVAAAADAVRNYVKPQPVVAKNTVFVMLPHAAGIGTSVRAQGHARAR